MLEASVISCRVRLARNIEGLPFPNAMTAKEIEELIGRIDRAINSNGDFLLLRMKELPQREKLMLVERHLISPALACSPGAALINRDETLSIMIGEEDHLRIQCLLPGLQLTKADELCAAVDRGISTSLSYAFSEELGYLTACPTNVGTGMRASVMVHLPSLALAGQTMALLREVAKIGYAVRGIYGEGTEAAGHIYQISNQMTLGMLEEDIVANLAVVARQVLEREARVRQSLFDSNRVEMTDIVFRSLGALTYARRMDTKEAMEHLSNLKLGLQLGLFSQPEEGRIDRLFTDIQSATLQQRMGRELSKGQREVARADLLRETLQT